MTFSKRSPLCVLVAAPLLAALTSGCTINEANDDPAPELAEAYDGPIELFIEADAQRDGEDAAISITVTSMTPQGLLVPGAEPLVWLAVGTEVELPVVLEEIEPGVFAGEVRTEIAGLGEIYAEIEGRSEEALELVAIPPGPIEDIEITVGEWALSNGIAKVEVIVAATDIVGNAAGAGDSEFAIETELPYEMAYNNCNEAVFTFTSTEPGAFEVTFTELGTGLSNSAEVPFALAGTRRPLEGHFYTDIGESRAISIPVEAYVPTNWEFNDAWLELTIEPGMFAIGGAPVVRDADPDDCAHPEAVFFPSELEPGALTGLVSIVVDPPGTGGCIRKPTFDFWLDFETGNGQPPPDGGGEVKGGARVDAVEANTPHPATNRLRWVDGIGLVIECTCEKATVYMGCVVYVRTPPKAGGKVNTDAQICEAHDRANEILDQACVSMDKTVIDKQVTGKAVERRLSSNKKVTSALRHTVATLGAQVPDNCMVVLLANDAKAKGVTVVAKDGSTSRDTEPANGGIVIERGVFRNGRTLAHELAHGLGLPHTKKGIKDRKTRLMTPTDGSKGRGVVISDGETTQIRKSGWLKAQEGLKYNCG